MHARFIVAACLGALLVWANAAAATNVVQVSAEIPEGKTKTMRLRKMPRGAIISVRVRSSASLQVALISATQLKSKKPSPIFRGALERSLAFQVTVPEPDDYYLVLDNRRGKKPVQTQTTISAKRAPSEPAAPGGPPATRPGEEGIDETRAALVPQA